MSDFANIKLNIDPEILKIFRDKKYLIFLQGCRGSGKTLFAHELQKHFPAMQIASIEEYFSSNNIEYNKHLEPDAYQFCKQLTNNYLNSGQSVIYCNSNLQENQIENLIEEAKNHKVCAIILRFLPNWNEEKCVEIAKFTKPNTQKNIQKNLIIKDNVKLINYKNKNKLGLFGVKCILNSDSEITFERTMPVTDNLKKLYIEKKLYKEIEIIKNNTCPNPKLKPKQNNTFMPFERLPPAVKLELIQKRLKVEELQQQIQDLQQQLSGLNINFTKDDIDQSSKRKRIDNVNEQ
jgi:predicted kinase